MHMQLFRILPWRTLAAEYLIEHHFVTDYGRRGRGRERTSYGRGNAGDRGTDGGRRSNNREENGGTPCGGGGGGFRERM